jgi:hypothetical protein
MKEKQLKNDIKGFMRFVYGLVIALPDILRIDLNPITTTNFGFRAEDIDFGTIRKPDPRETDEMVVYYGFGNTCC